MILNAPVVRSPLQTRTWRPAHPDYPARLQIFAELFGRYRSKTICTLDFDWGSTLVYELKAIEENGLLKQYVFHLLSHSNELYLAWLLEP